jgi:hypothetical protein
MGIMGMFSMKKAEPEPHAGELTPAEKGTPVDTPAETPAATTPAATTPRASLQGMPPPKEALKSQPPTSLACTMGAIASIGGFMFGYESGQISGMASHIICGYELH